jgi:hypothetical protein
MEEWAAFYGNKIGFVCASCSGPVLARTFGERLKLKYCNNVWLEENNMPTWGQLGCNGFIILDETHLVKCKATPAFLQINKEAFYFVEKMLNSFITGEIHVNTHSQCLEKVDSSCAKVFFGNDLISSIPSVKVDIIGKEHHECEEALRILRVKHDNESLSKLLRTFEDHFRHEEVLLDKHLYDKDMTGFSADMNARKSHFADHAKILDNFRCYLAYDDIPELVVNSISNMFHSHTREYDVNYADRLSEALKSM